VQIGEAYIGPESGSVFVIAEAGVNHNGDPTTALKMVDAAARAGANAVKFQAFRASALVTAEAPTAAYQEQARSGVSQLDMLRRLELPREAFAEIARHCRRRGIEFLATPFGIDELHMLVDLGVRAIKIASPDLVNVPLLLAAADTNLPILASTGAADAAEIDAAVALLEERGARDRLVLLHCVSSYPTREKDVNLRRIRALAARYHRPVGFSDHTTSVQIGAVAVAGGAVVLEKHFTLDRRQTGPDHGFSLEPPDLARYIAAVRRAEVALGDPDLRVLDVEREVRRVARSSVVAAAPIACGERIAREHLTIKRPGTGIAPAALEAVVGRVAAVDIPADSVIQWEMLR